MTTKTPSLLVKAASAIALAVLASCKPSEPAPEAKASPTPAPSPAAAAAPTASIAPASPASATTAPAGETVVAVELQDPVAIVNGDKISRADLEAALSNAVQASGMSAADLTPEQKMNGYRSILDDMITERLVRKAAESYQVPQAEVDAEIAKIKQQFPNEEEFNKQMAAAGQTPEKLQEVIKGMLQQKAWADSQLAGKVVVTEETAKKFFTDNPAQFQEPEKVNASHILILVDKDASEDVVKQKLAEIEKAEARLKTEDFETVAVAVSEDPTAKENKGVLGYFAEGQMVPEFSKAAFAMKVGEVSDPVRTEYGWHIIKVTDKKPAASLEYDQIKERLLDFLKEQEQRKAAQDLVKSLRDSAKIENTLPPAPAAPATPPGN